MDSYMHGIEWIVFHGHLDFFQKLPLGGRPNMKLGDHGILNVHNRWFILFYHVWGSAWIKIHWNSNQLRGLGHIWLHTTLEGLYHTLHDFGGDLGWPLDAFFWALANSWSQLLAHVWSDPKWFVMHSSKCITKCNDPRTDVNEFDWWGKRNALRNMWGILRKIRIPQIMKQNSTWIFAIDECYLLLFSMILNLDFKVSL